VPRSLEADTLALDVGNAVVRQQLIRTNLGRQTPSLVFVLAQDLRERPRQHLDKLSFTESYDGGRHRSDVGDER